MMIGLKGSEERKVVTATTIVFHVLRKRSSGCSYFYLGDIVCEALKQPLLNTNESRHVGPPAVNCVRTGCKMANAHEIVVATSLYTGYISRNIFAI